MKSKDKSTAAAVPAADSDDFGVAAMGIEEGDDEALAADVRSQASAFMALLAKKSKNKELVRDFWESRAVARGEIKRPKAPLVEVPDAPKRQKAKKQRAPAEPKPTKAKQPAAKAGKSAPKRKNRASNGLFDANDEMWEE